MVAMIYEDCSLVHCAEKKYGEFFVSSCISASHPMTAKCTWSVHFRMRMYAIGTWLIILGCASKRCTVGVLE